MDRQLADKTAMDMERAAQVMHKARNTPGGMGELLDNKQFCAGYLADADEQNPHTEGSDDHFYWAVGRKCGEA